MPFNEITPEYLGEDGADQPPTQPNEEEQQQQEDRNQEHKDKEPPALLSPSKEPEGFKIKAGATPAVEDYLSSLCQDDTHHRGTKLPLLSSPPNTNNTSTNTNNEPSSPAHHERTSSRIGTIYRTNKEKGIHIVDEAHTKVPTVAWNNNNNQTNVHNNFHPELSSPSLVFLNDQELPEQDATWNEVLQACCCHSVYGWLQILAVVVVLLLFLYFFMVGLDMLSTSFQVVSGCTAGSLLSSSSTNPLASVLIGIVATALLQSSSTTSSIVVSMCGAGLDVQSGIYIIIGANVGTSVTSMIVSLTHLGEGDELERAFSASSLYYLFNILTALVLLPLEVGTQYLYRLTAAMLPSTMDETGGDTWNSPIKAIVSPFTRRIIMANKQLITDVSTGVVDSCDSYYPVTCQDYDDGTRTCKAGLIDCDATTTTSRCPALFQVGASKTDDIVSGWVCLVLAIFLLCLCLVGLVTVLRKVLLGASKRIIYKATNMNGILAIMVGIGVTVLVQSSSATTSALVPLAGVGVLSLQQMYPLCVGADIGTTFTALMAALVSSKLESLQVALAHLFFNLTGAVMWYVLPITRKLVYSLAKKLGVITKHWRGFPIFFIVVVFFLIPLLLLGISTCFEQQSKGYTALGIFIVVLVVVGIVYFWVWWRFQSGKDKFIHSLQKRRRRKATIKTLPDDMDYVRADVEYCKKEITFIKDCTNIPHVVRMEEGVAAPPSTMDETEAAAAELDEAVSLYESCVSVPWTQVLVNAADSIKDDIGSTRSKKRQRRTYSQVPVNAPVAPSTHSARRRGGGEASLNTMSASGRSSRRSVNTSPR